MRTMHSIEGFKNVCSVAVYGEHVRELGNSIAIKFFNSSWRVSSTVVAGAVKRTK
jgi:hypothetical protein